MTDQYGLLILDLVADRIMSKACPVCNNALSKTKGIRGVSVSYDERSNAIIPYAICRGCMDANGFDRALVDKIDRKLKKSVSRYSAPEMVALIPGFSEALLAHVRDKEHGGH